MDLVINKGWFSILAKQVCAVLYFAVSLLWNIDCYVGRFVPSSDPLLKDLQIIISGLKFTTEAQDFSCLKQLYSRIDVFGVDLYSIGLGKLIESMASELFAGPGAIRRTLHKYVTQR